MGKTRHIFIGIDAGVHCGFAVWDGASKCFLEVSTLSFWDCIESLKQNADFWAPNGDKMTVVIEDVTQNKLTFYRHDTTHKGMEKISRNVGGVMAYTSLIMEWCERQGVEMIKSRPGKKSMTKMKAEAFKNLTKWEKKTSEHSRDAALLVFQR